MNFRFLETFVWVARLRSFSSAADKLCTTQAAVSNRIATLERELGVRLFDRDLRNVRLTPQGQNALASAEDIVRRVGDFHHTVGDRSKVRGTISIGTSDTLVYAWVPRLIRRMKNEYPNVGLDLTVDTSLHLSRQVQDGQISLALLMGPVVAPGMCNEPLCTYDSYWVAAAELEFPDRPLAFTDLAAYPLLSFSAGSLPHLALQRLAVEAGLGAEQLRVYNMNSLATNLRLLSDKIGVASLPLPVVDDALKRGELRLLNSPVKMPSMSFHAVYMDRPDDYLTAIVARMAIEIAAEETSRKPRYAAPPSEPAFSRADTTPAVALPNL